MTLFDFIRSAFYLLGEWISDHLGWVIVVVVAIIAVGLLLSDWKSTSLEEPTPDVLSEAQKDALRAWVMRQKMPPAPEIVALAQDWLALCREECTEERFDNPS